jgi:hypothetical protein
VRAPRASRAGSPRLGELARLELEVADVHPQARAVHRRAEPRDTRQEEQHDRADPEQVLVVLEHAVVASQADQRDGEQGEADHDPQRLLERVVGAEPVDLAEADRGQEAGHRQQVRVGVRDGRPRDHVRAQVEADEHRRVRERRPRDDRLPCDVHAREPDPGQRADGDQVGELAVALAHRGRFVSGRDP